MSMKELELHYIFTFGNYFIIFNAAIRFKVAVELRPIYKHTNTLTHTHRDATLSLL